MTWSIWDVLVILLFLGQIGAVVYVVLCVLKIKNGPVATVIGHVKPLTTSGKAIIATGKREVEQNKARWLTMAAEAKSLIRVVRKDVTAKPDGMLIDYKTIMSGVAGLKFLRRGWRQIQVARSKTANPPGPPSRVGKKPVSIADRLGLVPPVVKKAGPLLRVVKVLLALRKELANRGITA